MEDAEREIGDGLEQGLDNDTRKDTSEEKCCLSAPHFFTHPNSPAHHLSPTQVIALRSLRH